MDRLRSQVPADQPNRGISDSSSKLCQPLFVGEPRCPRVHHDDARREPRNEQSGAQDAEPAVSDDQHAAEPVHDSLQAPVQYRRA